MALSMLVAIVAAPALLGTQEAIRQSQSKERREEHRARRCNLIASCVTSSLRSREINGRPVVLRDGKLWIDTGTSDGTPYGHPYAGYYLPYPDSPYEGLVTTITDAAPIMNWIYIDRSTHEVKYGVRADAQPNLTGPFDCTRQDRRLTFDAWEGWCAVEEFPTLWALYFDLDDDGLRGKVPEGMRVLEIELTRKEKRFRKEGAARMQDQSTRRKVDAMGEVPVDEAVGGETEVKNPGVWGAEAEAEGQRDGSAPEAEPLKPFVIPKLSLFGDLPYAVTQVPPTPPTPPPAYSTTVPAAPPPVVAPLMSESAQDYETRDNPAPPRQTQSGFSPPPPPELSSLEQDDNTSPDLTPILATPAQQDPQATLETAADSLPFVPAPLRPKPSAESQRTPPGRPPRSPRSTSPNQTASASEKRTTPKLNRNSGTRALAQAQIFEAWARGQAPKETLSSKESLTPPRPVSIAASSVSEYSDPPQTAGLDVIDLYADRSDSNILPRGGTPSPPPPPPETLGEKIKERKSSSTKPSDPAVFGGFITPLDATKERNETARRSGRISAEYTIQRKDTKALDKDGTKGRLGSDRRPPSKDRVGRDLSEQIRRPSVSRTSTSSKEVMPPLVNRRPSAAKPSSQPTRTSRYSPPPAPPLTRTNTSPAPASASASPRGRGMTATMTSGTRNRAMTLRVGGKEAVGDASPRLERSRTNYTLYREISDLVGAQGEERRRPPLRRTATSRGQTAEGARDGGSDSARSRRRELDER